MTNSSKEMSFREWASVADTIRNEVMKEFEDEPEFFEKLDNIARSCEIKAKQALRKEIQAL